MSSRTPNSLLKRSIWSTASLRLAIAFSLLFGVGSAVLVIGVDYGLMRFAEAEVRAGLAHQLEIMRSDADSIGGAALTRELNGQPRNRDARRYLLLVQSPDGSLFSNGLTRQAVNANGFRRNLPTKARTPRWPDQTPNMMVLSGSASDGTFLAVGRDTQHLDELRGGVRGFALWSGLALVCLALLGGVFAGWLFLRRLEGVNQAVARIIAGQDSTRLPAIGLGREFDELSSNLNRMLDRQEAAFSALKALSEGVAHELRAPLNRLRNRLEEIAATAKDSETHDKAVALALEETDQLNALFEALLALASIESGSAQLSSQRVDISSLIGTIRDIYAPLVEEGGGALLAPVGQAGLVRGDANLIQQAISNLIENAIFHGGHPPEITLSLEAVDRRIILRVSDRGTGIPPEERARVTRRFHRLGHKTSPGWGLGLAMVDAVARAHGGELRLLDNAPGLTAELDLPADATV